MEPRRNACDRLKILMGSGVPRRREGGVAAIIYNLGRELERLGHEVTYIFLDDLVVPGEVSPRFVESIFSYRLARYIAQNRCKFSVVNLHAPSGMFYGLRRRWGKRDGWPPYVMTLHGLEERRAHVMRREAAKGRAWNFGWKNRMWHRLYHFPRFRCAIRTADGAHVYSRDVWNCLVLNYDLDSDRVRYVANGVEPRFFASRQYGVNVHVRLLYAGTWLDQRGIFYIRDALRNLKARKLSFTMTFAGPGVPAEEILRFFGDELAPQVMVRDVIPTERMQELYAEHDIFVFPSLMEGLPSVLLEAMAGGMPVITTETCGMPDVVEDGFNGLLIPPADARALEEAVAQLANSEELRSKLGNAARDSMQRYTWERAGKRLEELFRAIIEKQNISSPRDGRLLRKPPT
jgi:glycosyltransferase involved in cell wall biosynthesis